MACFIQKYLLQRRRRFATTFITNQSPVAEISCCCGARAAATGKWMVIGHAAQPILSDAVPCDGEIRSHRVQPVFLSVYLTGKDEEAEQKDQTVSHQRYHCCSHHGKHTNSNRGCSIIECVHNVTPSAGGELSDPQQVEHLKMMEYNQVKHEKDEKDRYDGEGALPVQPQEAQPEHDQQHLARHEDDRMD